MVAIDDLIGMECPQCGYCWYHIARAAHCVCPHCTAVLTVLLELRFESARPQEGEMGQERREWMELVSKLRSDNERLRAALKRIERIARGHWHESLADRCSVVIRECEEAEAAGVGDE